MMKFRITNQQTRTALTLLFFVFATVAFSQNAKPKWTTVLDATPASMRSQLVSSSEESIKVRLQVPGFYTATVSTPQGEAEVITVPNALNTAQAGEPNVPMIGIPAVIGNQARMDIRVTDAKYMDFENIMVAPSKGEFPRTIDPATVPYTFGECYKKDAFFPANTAELHEPYILRDYRGQNMAIHPFIYNPVTKTLRVYYDMTIEMYKVDDNGKNTLEPHRSNVVKMDPDFKSVYGRHFINYEAAQSKYTVLDEEGDLLIICHDNFINAMTDFVNWKRTRGVNTTIVGTSTAGTTYNALKTYIQNQYNANNNLTHVLLVGDAAQIPGYPYTGGGYDWSGKGDNPYGQIVGNDIYNDVIIGRFSAGNVTQVNTQVQRIITYERDLTTSDTWCQNGLGISASAGNSGHYNEDDYQHIENLRTDLLNYGYTTVYQDYKSVSGYPSSSTTTISNHINSGVGIINYCNHGEETGWQSHYYTNTNVNALTNNNKLPFIFSVACLVGKYDYSGGDCFAETWMHATNGSSPTGAIGGMFSYISQPWTPPMWAQDEFIDILTEQHPHNIKHSLGGVSVNGLLSIFDHYNTSSTEAVGTYQAWVLYGDPTMMLRTKTPQEMTVTHQGTIILNSPSYVVNVDNGEGALATITDADHNILGKAIVSDGTAEINIDGELTANSELTLCVFGYNKVTCIEPLTVIVPEGPYLVLDSYGPNTALVGADNEVSITFKNVGIDATEGTTTVTLTSSNEYVTFVNDSGTFDVLDADATTTVSGFTFQLNPGVDLESSVTLHFTAVNGENTWEGDLSFTPSQIFTVTASAYNDEYGTVSGGGEYYYNTPCTVTATAADGYLFACWTLDGNTVSTDAEYTFTVTGDMELVAHFSLGVVIGEGNTSHNYLPSYCSYKYAMTEQIYTPEELGSAGNIISIAFYNKGVQNSRNYDFYMKTTTKTEFADKTDWIAVEESDKVFSGEVTMVANEWTTITLNTPFQYNGNSNVVLVVVDNSGESSGPPYMSCLTFPTSTKQAHFMFRSQSGYDPTAPATQSGSNGILASKNQLILTKEPLDGPLPCSVPTELSVTEITGNSAVVSWQGEAASYKLQFMRYIDDATMEDETAWTTVSDATSPYTLSELESGTSYVTRVKAVCGTDSESDWTEAAQFTTILMGDANGNGGIDIGDAVCIINYVVGKPNTTFDAVAADLNGNGQIDVGDAVMVVNIVVGLTNDNLSAPAMNKYATKKEPE